MGGQSQIIAGSEGDAAEGVKVKARGAGDAEWDVKFAPRDGDIGRPGGGAGGEFGKYMIHGGIGAAVGRHVPGLKPLEPFTPIVAGGFEDQDVEVFVEQIDEGEKGVAAGLALEKGGGEGVGGCRYDDQPEEQGFEQPAEDHRINDVVNLKFVEA